MRLSVKKKLIALMALCILFCDMAYGQQDPNDPRNQDSLIIESKTVDSGTVNVGIQVWAVTDDTISYYIMPIHWNAPQGGVHLQLPHFYYGVLTQWAVHFDTSMGDRNYLRLLGICDTFDTLYHPPLFTDGQREHIISLRCVIERGTSPQIVTIDTCWDERIGSISWGLFDGEHDFRPAVLRGQITIRSLNSVDDVDNNLPIEFALSQNYPNPFNPETNIDFALPKESYVSLVVYNLLGQEVRRLVDGRIAAGEHTALWDGRGYNGLQVPSGVYFYKLTAPEFSKTYKMILLR